jgi:DNA-3-methyladenine glycosylase I
MTRGRRCSGLAIGPDGVRRCWWALASRDYMDYHDEEWGRPVIRDDLLLERVCLEGFQSGLSWITILRKREAFRSAFARFRIQTVAAFDEGDVERLLRNDRIIRNRRKIVAAIANARAAMNIIHERGSFGHFIWSFRPDRERPPRTPAEIPSSTRYSEALARALRSRGFRFVGPTTAYALMQACGLVNDHIIGCFVRSAVTTDRRCAIKKIEGIPLS